MAITTPVDYHYDLYFKFRSKYEPVFVILIMVSILSVIGNILVVLISGFYMRLRSLSSIFILNLALSDLLFTTGPLLVIHDYIQGSTSGYLACRVVGFASSTGFYTSTVLLVLMNIQRYMVTVHSYSGWKKGRCVTLGFVCVWMVGITAALPNPHFSMYSSFTTLVCNAYRMNIFFVFASVIMCFCSIRILQTIIKSQTNQKRRTTVHVLPLTAMFFICWAPYNIVIFLFILGNYGINLNWDHVLNALYICTPLAFSQCCINPIIYSLYGLKFRKEIFPRRDNLNSGQIEMKLNN